MSGETAGFFDVVHSEWTKLRTVPGWLAALLLAVILGAGLSVLSADGSHSGSCVGTGPAHMTCTAGDPTVATGPNGQAVADTYYLVHRSLAGDGTITARVISLTGMISPGNLNRAYPGEQGRPGLDAWAKAGVIVTSSTKAGAPYAAVMATGGHGVRFQYDYVNDRPGLTGRVSAAHPTSIRLVRQHDTITGYDSPYGSAWTEIGSTTLPSLPATVDVGLFVTSPASYATSAQGQSTSATGTFDDVSLTGTTAASRWTATSIGGGNTYYPTLGSDSYHHSGATFVITGSGDVASGILAGLTAQSLGGGQLLVGLLIGLIILIVIAAGFMSAEYRRQLIRTTFAATPDRRQVLLAKALVIGSVAFVAEVVAVAVSLPIVRHVLIENGNYLFPSGLATDVRIVVVSGLLVAFGAIAVLGLATLLRRSAGAVVAGIACFVLPYVLGTILSTSPGGTWLFRLSPAAGFAALQSVPPASSLVSYAYNVNNGYYPLAFWAALAVSCGYAVVALGVAMAVIRRRDA